jgi:nucleoporin SEH1
MTAAIAAPADSSAASQQQQVLSSFHSDYIYKVAFDTYGRRMATCSGDRFVRVWDLTDSGEWSQSAHWQAHRGSVVSLAWAHPEYGCLLATAGSDQDAKIWEERSPMGSSNGVSNSNVMMTLGGGPNSANNNNNHPTTSRWSVKASLTEARRAVTCLEFAPRHFGLKLAVGSADGCVRIYEAVDVSLQDPQ